MRCLKDFTKLESIRQQSKIEPRCQPVSNNIEVGGGDEDDKNDDGSGDAELIVGQFREMGPEISNLGGVGLEVI
jgi:hypothetical protein